VALYGDDHDTSQKNVVLGDSYAQIALTNAAAAGGSELATAYLNGAKVAAARISKGFDLGSGVLRFFRDNRVGPYPGEESSGAVSCILVYDSLGGRLDTRRSARVSGRLKGARASGTLSRAGTSASGARCAVGGIGWHARATRVEFETPTEDA
jgi:hypothetical protein